MEPRYSGIKSAKFWAKINALPKAQRDEAYSLGVVLQNVEADVLRLIALAKGKSRKS